jgi:hypothetical protein
MFSLCCGRRVIALILLVFSTRTCLAQLNRSSEPVTLKTYSLQERVNSADISPDESLVAIERTTEQKTADGKTLFSEIVELWNFREDRVVAAAPLRNVEDRSVSSERAFDPLKTPRFVRFSGDGKVVVVFVDDSITLLLASDLGFLRSVIISVPPSRTRSFVTHKGRGELVNIVVRPELRAMEMSPTGTFLAILWTTGYVGGRVDFYDISTGQRIAEWDAPPGEMTLGKGHRLAWDLASPTIFVAVPNASPCGGPTQIPDVIGVDARTGRTKVRFTSGLIVGDIAVTPGHELLAVENNCVGVLADHHPRMKVFDLNTGKLAKDVRADGTGVRYAVSASRDGQRAVAWTSDVRCQFDWLDGHCGDHVIKTMLTTWHLPDFSVIASVAVSFPTDSPLRMSSTGRYVLTYGKTASVFELP